MGKGGREEGYAAASTGGLLSFPHSFSLEQLQSERATLDCFLSGFLVSTGRFHIRRIQEKPGSLFKKLFDLVCQRGKEARPPPRPPGRSKSVRREGGYGERAWLPYGYSQIFRSYVFGPSGFWPMAPLCYAAKFDPFLSLDFAPTPSTLAQSKERKGSNVAIWQP